MPKTKISEFDLTPANNTDIDSIDIGEGCAPSGINNAIRELMSQLKDFQGGTSGDKLAIAAGGTNAATTTAALQNLGGTTTGINLFKAASSTVARTELGATTIGGNLFTLSNPSAITFPRFNADNTVSALDAASFRTAIGAGSGTGTVTSVGGTGTVNGITLTGTVTSSGSLTLGGTLSGVSLTTQVTGTLPIANGGTGSTSTAYCSLTSNVTGTLPVANGGTGVTSSTGSSSVVLSTAPTITGLRETRVAMAASNVDLNAGNYFTRTISGATSLTVSNVPASGTSASFILDLTNGGSNTITWFTGTKWAGGVAPTLTTSGRDVLGFFTHDGGTTWNGFVLGKDVK